MEFDEILTKIFIIPIYIFQFSVLPLLLVSSLDLKISHYFFISLNCVTQYRYVKINELYI